MSESRLIETDAEYYSIKDRLSASGLKYLNQHPKAYLHYAQNGIEATQAMNTGKLIHSLLLEPHTVKDQYVYLEKKLLPNPDKDFRDSDNKKFKAKFLEDNKDKIVFDKEDDYLNLIALTNEVHRNPTARRLLSGCQIELGMLWTNFETDVAMKGKPDGFKKSDGLSRSYILDVKKFPDIHPEKVRRYIMERFIHSQLAVYADGLREFDFGDMDDYYIFAIQENNPPDFAVYRINEFIEEGWNEFVRLANKYKNCMDTGIWEGYEQYADDEGVIPLTFFGKRDLVV